MPDWKHYEPDLDAIVVTRLTLGQRIQHLVLVVSFLVLIVTGLPLLFPEVIHVPQGTFAIRTFVHRYAGVVLILLALHHAAYVLFTEQGRRDFGHMIP
ncbi:MAG: cytochrome b/b6 domain-containing protein, partial [Gemmatimonadales bacterium]